MLNTPIIYGRIKAIRDIGDNSLSIARSCADDGDIGAYTQEIEDALDVVISGLTDLLSDIKE